MKFFHASTSFIFFFKTGWDFRRYCHESSLQYPRKYYFNLFGIFVTIQQTFMEIAKKSLPISLVSVNG
jgi:hypothetical protein